MQMLEPRNRPHPASRRSVLLTGASGVVGRPLLDRLNGFDVICLVHRTPVTAPGVESVQGDVPQRLLGLDAATYTALARRVDAVIHCAAVTDFYRKDGTLERTNVVGTEHVVAFAAEAGAVLYHVSTAFVETSAVDGRGHTAAGYAVSKSLAEEVVRTSSVPYVIIRPSVVVGDSATGEITAFQGLHHIVQGIFAGLVPIIPFDPSWPIDFVPCDYLADAITRLVEDRRTEGEFWVTAGERALRLDQGVELCVTIGRELGVTFDPPRFVPPEMFDRLIGPVFLDALPTRIRRSTLRLLEFFTTYLQSGQVMPSSAEQLADAGVMPLPDPRETFRRSVLFWAGEKGYAAADLPGYVPARPSRVA
jgi:nucleoside-diphosphate-sugar epimerase